MKTLTRNTVVLGALLWGVLVVEGQLGANLSSNISKDLSSHIGRNLSRNLTWAQPQEEVSPPVTVISSEGEALETYPAFPTIIIVERQRPLMPQIRLDHGFIFNRDGSVAALAPAEAQKGMETAFANGFIINSDGSVTAIAQGSPGGAGLGGVSSGSGSSTGTTNPSRPTDSGVPPRP